MPLVTMFVNVNPCEQASQINEELSHKKLATKVGYRVAIMWSGCTLKISLSRFKKQIQEDRDFGI